MLRLVNLDVILFIWFKKEKALHESQIDTFFPLCTETVVK